MHNHKPLLIGIVLLFCAPIAPGWAQSQLESHTVVISGDPVGFLFLGPTFNVEFVPSPLVGITAGLRVTNLGVTSSLIYGEDLKMSWMLFTSARFYVLPNRHGRGFFVGPRLEFGRTNWDDETYEWYGWNFRTVRYTRSNKTRAFGAELGYKWVWRSGFSLELADLIGLIQYKEDDDVYKDDTWHTDRFAFYLLSVKVGFAF
jgi:hypothetical protein